MLEREWVSIADPEDPHYRYVFDVSFLLSSYTCIYGAGCPGIHESAGGTFGCCRMGAHYVDDEDREKVEAMVDRLGPEHMQFYDQARRDGVTARDPDGSVRTRVRDGGCIFLNRAGWHAGPGCALHQFAAARGEHHMTYKPEVCWLVPLRREVEEDVADDGETLWTTTITSYDRGAWGPGGADFDWWCTESPEAYVGVEPVYRSMSAELREMTSDAVYDELAAYLDDRWSRPRRPMLLPLVQR
jgi:hypothetical protein